MRSHRGGERRATRGPSSFSADVFFRGPRLASRRAAISPSLSPPSPKKMGRYGGTQYESFRAPTESPVYGLGLKLFSLSGRFVRVCKTVAKLLAGLILPGYSRDAPSAEFHDGSNDELSSFFIRYAARATIPARNRESGFPSRRRVAHVTFLRRWTGRQHVEGECPPSY